MKKVILLSASPREDSNTMTVLDECASAIEGLGIETEIISLRNMNVRACIACGKCAQLKRCIFDDGLNEIIAKIKESQGFICAAPVYFGTARGDVMNALQRIGYVSKQDGGFLSWKVGGPIAIGRRGGHTSTLQEMLMFYLINDMIVPGSNYWNMVFARNPGEALDDEEGIATIQKFGENVAKLIEKIS